MSILTPLYLYLFLSVDFIIDKKGTPLLESYNKWRSWADPKVCCDYGLHMGITFWDDTVTKDMETLCSEKGNLLNGSPSSASICRYVQVCLSCPPFQNK